MKVVLEMHVEVRVVHENNGMPNLIYDLEVKGILSFN